MKYVVSLLILLCCSQFIAQHHSYCKITFERRTNLEKRYTDQRMKRMINESNKIRNEEFAFYFNDTVSAFVPIQDNNPSDVSWMFFHCSDNFYMSEIASRNAVGKSQRTHET